MPYPLKKGGTNENKLGLGENALQCFYWWYIGFFMLVIANMPKTYTLGMDTDPIGIFGFVFRAIRCMCNIYGYKSI